ncbi:hypothetical protein L249_2169 [Ophiocordyceps polyrhachis-furcata BCC 54312]|uniref:Uncharacterized protein n=1 Tax=Ophiocordyceps polyrhachis-furcata BCC 54312 TaxID=1330021 RepID=A0A367LRZ3_9HYPO|nr:hypothetical protein L249_2169 [Ophiocordyceps polyrhachis-furcata BCC 54312]
MSRRKRLLLLLLLPAPLVLGCKCVDLGGNADRGLTRHCCYRLGGFLLSDDDCFAHSISDDLFGFRLCCGGEWLLGGVWRDSDCEAL